MIKALRKLDHRCSLGAHKLTKSHDKIHTLAVVFARWVFWLLLLGLVVAVFARRGPIFVRELLFVLGLSILLGIIFNLILGKIFVRKRPFETHKLHALISTTWLGGSFPSDHAMFSFAVATPLWIFDPITGIWAIIVACLIAVSRVAVGVHYWTDVIVGTAVGVGAAYIALAII
ncbi:phosphatase PAP2 family protein [Candidatus Uhrbacteria bacterium]|jgi:undecaprenyl-diphosphatase|nr:phosphatase PAP2 family protein [Candidatus Uhrbacteria bacterium]